MVVEVEVVTEQVHHISKYGQILYVVVLLSEGLLYNFAFAKKLLSVYMLGHEKLVVATVSVGSAFLMYPGFTLAIRWLHCPPLLMQPSTCPKTALH